MSFEDDASKFCGKTIVDFDPEHTIDLAKQVYRLRAVYDESSWSEIWKVFIAEPWVSAVEELVIGMWLGDLGDDEGRVPVEALLAARQKLPNLKAIYLGDIDSQESEISWINQSDVSPLFPAFPKLEVLKIRGGNNLAFSKPVHDQLKVLVVESGGLPRTVVQQLGQAQFPSLSHLELWLGEDNYGGDTQPQDLAPILSGDLFPNLTYLGLCNSEIADDIAAAVADAPILERLEILDLSKGNMSDVGAEALLQFPLVSRLKRLDLTHHYISPGCIARLEKAGIHVEAGDRQEADDFGDGEILRHIYVSE